MGSSRRRIRRRKPARFKAWGLLLTVLAAIAAYGGQWTAAVVFGGILLFYLLAVRLTRCRVETVKHRPCLWIVRGLAGTCDYHVGYKRGLPRLVRGEGFGGLPTLMWPRDDFAGLTAMRFEPQPQPGRAVTPQAGRRGYEGLTVLLTVGGLLIALVGVVRDFVAG
ncbi:hypothetical protein [Kribbella sp. CA-247076]|uniref:hypothetical protein n=1 Tax=Kribbella sp. CA-247076 TaxID=3239941 RepID=UPI003D905ACB